MKRHLLWTVGLVLMTGAPRPVQGQTLSNTAMDRCVRSAVKVVALGPGGSGATGSGTVIDPRGYVLTNFHVVGHLTPEDGPPGELINRANRYTLAMADSAREPARPRWIGTVVRANTRLDLALLRILTDTDGNVVEGNSFPWVPVSTTAEPQPAATLWAFGFPQGVRTVRAVTTLVSGFRSNAFEQAAWFELDREIDPGYTGGMLVDSQGQLLGVPTAVGLARRGVGQIALVRPAARMPREWAVALRRGHVRDVRIDGILELRRATPIHDVAVGDSAPADRPETHYYRLPRGQGRLVRVSPALPIELLTSEGELLRRDVGEVVVQEGDRRTLFVAVRVRNVGDEPTAYTIETDPPPLRAPVAAPRPVQDPSASILAPLVTGPFFAPSRSGGAGAAVSGRVVDAVTGRPIVGAMVVIAKVNVDLRDLLTRFLTGEISERAFSEQLIGRARTDLRGNYEVRDIPQRGRYRAASFAAGYRSAFWTLDVRDQRSVTLGAIEMTR